MKILNIRNYNKLITLFTMEKILERYSEIKNINDFINIVAKDVIMIKPEWSYVTRKKSIKSSLNILEYIGYIDIVDNNIKYNINAVKENKFLRDLVKKMKEDKILKNNFQLNEELLNKLIYKKTPNNNTKRRILSEYKKILEDVKIILLKKKVKNKKTNEKKFNTPKLF